MFAAGRRRTVHVMASLNINAARCEALFASTVQRSEHPTPAELREAIMLTVRALGSRGCAVRVAQEFGDHPDTAVVRMRWVRQQVASIVKERPNPR